MAMNPAWPSASWPAVPMVSVRPTDAIAATPMLTPRARPAGSLYTTP